MITTKATSHTPRLGMSSEESRTSPSAEVTETLGAAASASRKRKRTEDEQAAMVPDTVKTLMAANSALIRSKCLTKVIQSYNSDDVPAAIRGLVYHLAEELDKVQPELEKSITCLIHMTVEAARAE